MADKRYAKGTRTPAVLVRPSYYDDVVKMTRRGTSQVSIAKVLGIPPWYVCKAVMMAKTAGDLADKLNQRPDGHARAVPMAKRAVDQPDIKTKPLPKLRVVEFNDNVDPLLLEDLGSRNCSYPINDEAPYLFCARDKLFGTAYCKAHMALAYTERQVRKARR